LNTHHVFINISDFNKEDDSNIRRDLLEMPNSRFGFIVVRDTLKYHNGDRKH